jgi:hypothetical protein
MRYGPPIAIGGRGSHWDDDEDDWRHGPRFQYQPPDEDDDDCCRFPRMSDRCGSCSARYCPVYEKLHTPPLYLRGLARPEPHDRCPECGHWL